LKNTFCKASDIGNKGESRVKELFEKASFVVTKNPEKYNREKMGQWDLRIGEVLVEVKTDAMSEKTGNIAVETFNTKLCKPSGITSTTAQFWCYCFLNGQIWIAKVTTLRSFLGETKPFREIPSGGDDNAYLVLYKRDVILGQCFVRIDNLPVESLAGVLV
jgi:hypothetical protein